MSTVSFCKLQWWITAQKMKFSIKDFFSKCVQIRRTKSYLSNAILAKTQDFTMNGRHVLWKTDFIIYGWDMLWKVETLWWSVEICHSRSRFCYETVKISWWQVEILLWVVNVFMMTAPRDFVMNTRDFHDGSSRFLWKKVEILLWTVEILRMTGQYFHNDRSRFLWQVKTLLHVEIFMKTVRGFHDDV